jgi:hypothetical protein
MIRIICPKCGSKINAKAKLIGEIRPCPKCREPLVILAPEVTDNGPSAMAAEPSATAKPSATADEPLASLDLPTPVQTGLIGDKQRLSLHPLKKLNRLNRYWIVDHAHIVASWSGDGKGWMLKTNAGMVSAVRNRDKIPTQGNFVVVELKLEMTEAGLRLRGIAAFQLPPSWALPVIGDGDNLICDKIVQYGSLTKEQKGVIRLAIREQLMHELLEGAEKIMEYLCNADYHTHKVDCS